MTCANFCCSKNLDHLQCNKHMKQFWSEVICKIGWDCQWKVAKRHISLSTNSICLYREPISRLPFHFSKTPPQEKEQAVSIICAAETTLYWQPDAKRTMLAALHYHVEKRNEVGTHSKHRSVRHPRWTLLSVRHFSNISSHFCPNFCPNRSDTYLVSVKSVPVLKTQPTLNKRQAWWSEILQP